MIARSKMAVWLLTAVSLTATAAAVSQASDKPPSPQDFAYGMKFETHGSAAAFRSSLPVQVYQGVPLADLLDVAVFNERNEVVPHVLEVARTQSTQRQPPVSFPVFPLRGNESLLQLITRTGGLGIFADRSNIRVIRREGIKLTEYIVDYDAIIKGDLKQDLLLRPGDRIVIP